MAKTLRSRIAAVAVAALGVGLLQAAPANAAATALSMSVTESKGVTVVGTGTPYTVIRVAVTGTAALPGLETATAEQVGYEVTAVPAASVACGAPATTDLVFTEVSNYAAAADGGADNLPANTIEANNTGTLAAVGSATKYYFLKIASNVGAALDCGAYTVRLSLLNAAGLVVTRSSLTIKYVSNLADSGASIAIGSKGFWYQNESIAVETARYLTATLTDANGGAVRTGTNAAPTLTGTIGTTAVLSTALSLADDGVPANDAGGATAVALNGVYGITSGAITQTPTAADALTVTVKYGAAISKTATVTVYPTPTATRLNSIVETTTASLLATGNDAADARDYVAPLTASSVDVKLTAKTATDVVPNAPMTFTVAYGGADLVAGDLTPAATDTPKVIRTDNAGVATFTIANARPIDGVSAVVTVTGFATAGNSKTFTITWKKSAPVFAVSDPNGDFIAKLKATNTITFTVLDAFSNPVANTTVKATISGANASTTAPNTVSKVTDANGQFVYTWTDAAAVADDTDTITVTTTAGGSLGQYAAVTVTYKAAVPVISKFVATYDSVENAANPATTVPATAILSGATGFRINTDMDTSKNILGGGGVSSQLKFRFAAKDAANAAVSGVPVVVTASSGGWVLSATGRPVTSRTFYPTTGNVDFVVTSTTVGDVTFTVTAGTVSSKAIVRYINDKSDARTVAFTKSGATATASSSTLPSYTVVVSDRFGNPVSDAVLSITHTGVGSLAGGAKVLSYTTDDTGSLTFEATSADAGTATITARASVAGGAAQMADAAGYVGATEVAGVTAGVRSVSATTTFAAATVVKSAAELAAEAAKAEAAKATAEAAKATAAVAALSATITSIQTAISTLVASTTATLTALTAKINKIMKKLKI